MLRWRNLRTSIKIGLLSTAGVIIVALVFWSATSWQSSWLNRRAAQEANRLAVDGLGHVTLGLLNMVRAQDAIAQEQLRASLSSALHMLDQPGGVGLDNEKTIRWVAVNATTAQTMSVSLPQMLIGARLPGGDLEFKPVTSIIHELVSLAGGKAAIYQRINEQGDMICVASSLEAEDSGHSPGSWIPALAPSGGMQPVNRFVLAGETYSRSEVVGGQWHRVAYAPLRDAGDRVIGMLFIGVPRGEEGALREAMVETKVGVRGEVFVLAAKGEERGTYRVSKGGSLDGVNIWDAVNAEGRYVVREIVETALALEEGTPGTLRYSWKAPDETVPHMRITSFAYYEPWDWVIAVSGYEDEMLAYRDELEGARTGMLNYLALSGAITVTVVSVLSFVLARSIVRPLRRLTAAAQEIAGGVNETYIEVQRDDEVGLLSESLNQIAEQLHGLTLTMESQVTARTRDLMQRSAYLSGTADVARVVAQIHDAESLLSQVVDLIRDNFGLYYVGLFLIDDEQEWAVLRAGTGEAGRKMLARNHRIRVGEGMVGWSIANCQPRFASEVGEDGVRLSTAELPYTRSEAALPLHSRGRVLGALTVQSDQPTALNDNVIGVLQTMADLVAVALENAQLLERAQDVLVSERGAYEDLTRRSRAGALGARAERGYRCDRDGIRALMVAATSPVTAAPSVASVEDASTLVVPLKSREQCVGLLRVRRSQDAGMWSEEDKRLVTSVAEQASAALESARLYEDTLRRIERERLVRQIADHIRASGSVEQALQRTIGDLSRVLEGAEWVVQLGREPSTDAEETA